MSKQRRISKRSPLTKNKNLSLKRHLRKSMSKKKKMQPSKSLKIRKKQLKRLSTKLRKNLQLLNLRDTSKIARNSRDARRQLQLKTSLTRSHSRRVRLTIIALAEDQRINHSATVLTMKRDAPTSLSSSSLRAMTRTPMRSKRSVSVAASTTNPKRDLTVMEATKTSKPLSGDHFTTIFKV